MAIRLPSSPALSHCRRDSAENGFGMKFKWTFAAVDVSTRDGKKRKWTFAAAVDGSACGDERDAANATLGAASSTQSGAEVLDERLWKMLPEELLDMIVARLPYPYQCRFRCVCRKWKGFQSLLPLPPPCTVVRSGLGDGKDRFYCDSEQKWVSLPPPRNLGPCYDSWTWELADVDAGLASYQSKQHGRFWFCIFDSVKPSSPRVITPDYRFGERISCPKHEPQGLKLLVDRANKSFKLVARLDLLHEEPWTAIYNSKSNRWKCYLMLRRLSSFRYFVWENVVHAYDTEEKLLQRDNFVGPLNMKQECWSCWTRTKVEFPSEFLFPTNRFILSDNNEVMLVLFSNKKRKRPYFSVWKLSKFNGVSGFAKPDLLFELTRASYRAGHICLVFWDDRFRIKDEGSKDGGSSVYKFVTYSFATKSWSLMPCPGDLSRDDFDLYNWEPAPDMDLQDIINNRDL